jgi:uncharacterized protein YkwD
MNTPVGRACDDRQYACLSFAPASTSWRAEVEMTDDEARDYVRDYVNGVRKINSGGFVVRDARLDAFAQAGSEQLAKDHQPGQHLAAYASELQVASAEIQGAPEGSTEGLLQDKLAAILLGAMNEGHGGVHRETLLNREWEKIGVGIVKRDGRTYLTIDLSE